MKTLELLPQQAQAITTLVSHLKEITGLDIAVIMRDNETDAVGMAKLSAYSAHDVREAVLYLTHPDTEAWTMKAGTTTFIKKEGPK